MKPVNWSLDRKRSLIIAFIVILSFFFFNNFARRRAGKVLLLGRLHTTFLKKSCLFFPAEKILGMVMWRVILVILDMFSHVW